MGFNSEKIVKSVRKQHRCDGCGTLIKVGEPAWRWSGISDGDFGTCIYHPDCRTAEVAYNSRVGTNTYDEWCGVRDAFYEDEDGTRDWLREHYAVVAARFESEAAKPASDPGAPR